MPPLLDRARDVLADLVVATGTTARLGVLDGLRVAYAQAEPDGPPPSRFLAATLPAHTTALGRVLLAFSPASIVEDAIATVPTGGASARCGPDRLRRSLGVTRLTRVAVAPGPDGAGAAAMAVFGAGGEVVAALELAVEDLRTGLRGARAALVVATGSLSRHLATAPSAPVEPASAG